MASLRSDEELIQLHVADVVTKPLADGNVAAAHEDLAANGAPAGEPEVWDEAVQAFNPLFGETPEPEPMQASPAMAAEMAGTEFEIEAFFAEERGKDLLRFSTAGSVDDGKSTLIGRLLYDTRAVYEDQLQSIEGKGSAGAGVLDLALLTDGLRAEREQGITIDVAYRYFSTARRKFIIADTPGHEQYTRNMATGASTADLAIVLVDARKGVLPQSRRHASITALLGVRHVVVAVNKMDLVGYDEAVFDRIAAEFTAFFREIRFGDASGTKDTVLQLIPVSALAGDNVARGSEEMPWYTGPTLLDVLETTPVNAVADDRGEFRLAVQRVVRPDANFRGFAGQIAAGTIRAGDEVAVLPSRRRSRVSRIVTFDGDLPEASAPLSVTLTLEDEVDISRGDLLVRWDAAATLTDRFRASLVWMDEQPMEVGRRYLLKHTTRVVPARVTRLVDTVDVATMRHEQGPALTLNGIALVEMESLQALAADVYAANRTTGSFILIDPVTNATVGAGMLRALHAGDGGAEAQAEGDGPVTAAEREQRWGQRGLWLQVSGPQRLADALERALLERGRVVLQVGGTVSAAVAQELAAAGLLVVTREPGEADDQFRLQIGGVSGGESIDGVLDRDDGLRAAVRRAVEAVDGLGRQTQGEKTR